MKILVLILVLYLCFYSKFSDSQVTGTFTDPRDGTVYKTVTIGTQTWMAENLKYSKSSSPTSCYNNDTSNCRKYGRLYSFNAASSSCPPGWELPSDAQWGKLLRTSKKIMMNGNLKSKDSWHEPNDCGTDDFGFSALPGGFRDKTGYYFNLDYQGYWWTRTVLSDGYNAWYRQFSFDRCSDDEWKATGNYEFSVRCIKD